MILYQLVKLLMKYFLIPSGDAFYNLVLSPTWSRRLPTHRLQLGHGEYKDIVTQIIDFSFRFMYYKWKNILEMVLKHFNLCKIKFFFARKT